MPMTKLYTSVHPSLVCILFCIHPTFPPTPPPPPLVVIIIVIVVAIVAIVLLFKDAGRRGYIPPPHFLTKNPKAN